MENLIAGRQPVLEALRSDAPLEKIYLLFGTHGGAIQAIQQLAKRRGVPVQEIDKRRFTELCPDVNAQGVFATASVKAYAELDDLFAAAEACHEPPFFLILDEIEDPHNLGALLRTAECAGVHGAIVPRHHSAPMNETVAKSSAGAVLHLPVAKVTNIAATIDELKERGVWVIGTEMDSAKPYDAQDYAGPIAVVVGNEGKGMRKLVKEKCDFLVRIPMYGKIGSLNASVAGALILFEAAKRRHQSGGETKQR
ncbi:MAG TPA: 23S rRNA (guanosine(2251)-2'-O)-methyltransferase RlmB [Bacteroidota bacterium]|nr:23S rRNA (guanosine(2251)-2'-O)-methyltransferase RlmB [Bacteroidota bacterium]